MKNKSLENENTTTYERDKDEAQHNWYGKYGVSIPEFLRILSVHRENQQFDDLVQGLDPTKLSLDEFVSRVIEHGLGEFWPQPESEFFCRCCNYIEFETNADLSKHLKSFQHKLLQKCYIESFCLACQVNTLNQYGMKWHKKTESHKKRCGKTGPKFLEDNENNEFFLSLILIAIEAFAVTFWENSNQGNQDTQADPSRNISNNKTAAIDDTDSKDSNNNHPYNIENNENYMNNNKFNINSNSINTNNSHSDIKNNYINTGDKTRNIQSNNNDNNASSKNDNNIHSNTDNNGDNNHGSMSNNNQSSGSHYNNPSNIHNNTNNIHYNTNNHSSIENNSKKLNVNDNNISINGKEETFPKVFKRNINSLSDFLAHREIHKLLKGIFPNHIPDNVDYFKEDKLTTFYGCLLCKRRFQQTSWKLLYCHRRSDKHFQNCFRFLNDNTVQLEVLQMLQNEAHDMSKFPLEIVYDIEPFMSEKKCFLCMDLNEINNWNTHLLEDQHCTRVQKYIGLTKEHEQSVLLADVNKTEALDNTIHPDFKEDGFVKQYGCLLCCIIFLSPGIKSMYLHRQDNNHRERLVRTGTNLTDSSIDITESNMNLGVISDSKPFLSNKYCSCCETKIKDASEFDAHVNSLKHISSAINYTKNYKNHGCVLCERVMNKLSITNHLFSKTHKCYVIQKCKGNQKKLSAIKMYFNVPKNESRKRKEEKEILTDSYRRSKKRRRERFPVSSFSITKRFPTSHSMKSEFASSSKNMSWAVHPQLTILPQSISSIPTWPTTNAQTAPFSTPYPTTTYASTTWQEGSTNSSSSKAKPHAQPTVAVS